MLPSIINNNCGPSSLANQVIPSNIEGASRSDHSNERSLDLSKSMPIQQI